MENQKIIQNIRIVNKTRFSVNFLEKDLNVIRKWKNFKKPQMI